MSKVTIYGQENCPHCVKARAFAEALFPEDKIEYLSISGKPEVRQECAAKLGYEPPTMPQVFIGESHVGGADDLLAVPLAVVLALAA